VDTLRQKAATAVDGAETVEVWIDGVAVKNIRSYRAASPEPFPIVYPQGAVFGLDAGVYYPQVSDGYWLMLAPFSKGVHTIALHVVNSAAGIDMHLLLHLVVGR
jgi:hypothetical protein